MISIKDIYQWYNNEYTNAPHPPTNLTPLQKIEWEEKNSQAVKEYENYFKNKSFIGELLVGAPAIINSIEKNKITATSLYIKIRMDQYYFEKFDKHDIPDPEYELGIKYDIFYDDSLYETIKSIHNNSMVKINGEIINFSRKMLVHKTYVDWESYTNWYFMKLNLSSIEVIKGELLYSNLLNDKHYFYSHHKSCFIATAAFGNQDITEVIQLREFRDKFLRTSISGRFFITTYGILSPPIALIIKQSKWLRKLARSFLRKVVLPQAKRRLQG